MKKIKKLISVLLVMLIVCTLFCSSLPTVSGAEVEEKEWLTFDELVERDGFINGIQQPWFIHNSTGNCIGKSFIDGYNKTFFDEDLFYEVFTNSKAMGFDIVKLWLTYQFDGMLFDENGVVVGIEPTFIQNLPRVFEIAEECGVYICITVVNHFESSYYRDGKVRYEEVFRFVYNPADTELFIKNFLKPVLEVTKKFDNVIMADIFCEPESNGGQWGLQIGTRWEHIVRFVNRVCEAIEEIDPKLVTYCSASGNIESVTDGDYDDMDIDCYGYDYYSTNGEGHDTSELFLTKPFVYGEVGTSSSNTSEEYLSSWMSNYLETASVSGVKAGFYWYYGFTAQKTQSVVDSKNRLRGASLAVHYWDLDREYAKTGYEGMDKPTMMYSTSDAIRWFGSRGSVKSSLQRSDDGKTWTTLLSFDPFDSEAVANYEYAAFMYEYKDETLLEGKTYYFRALAEDEEGNVLASDPTKIYVDIVTCSDEDNLIRNHSFEEDELISAGKWEMDDQRAPYNMVHFKNGDVDAHTGTTLYTNYGDKAVFKATRLFQAVTLKPNTDYIFTFHFKFDYVEYYWGCTVGLLNNYPGYGDFNNYYTGPLEAIRIHDKYKDGDWHRYSVKFNSGDFTDLDVGFYAWHGGAQQNEPDNVLEWYIDDVYLFEAK